MLTLSFITSTMSLPMEGISMTPEYLATLSNNDLLAAWNTLKTQLDNMKNLELFARNLCVDKFSNPAIFEGTSSTDIGNGYKLVIIKKLNYKLSSNGEAVNNVKDLMKQQGIDFGRFFKSKEELVVKEYKDTTDVNRGVLSSIVTISPATPFLEIKAPKI